VAFPAAGGCAHIYSSALAEPPVDDAGSSHDDRLLMVIAWPSAGIGC